MKKLSYITLSALVSTTLILQTSAAFAFHGNFGGAHVHFASAAHVHFANHHRNIGQNIHYASYQVNDYHHQRVYQHREYIRPEHPVNRRPIANNHEIVTPHKRVVNSQHTIKQDSKLNSAQKETLNNAYHQNHGTKVKAYTSNHVTAWNKEKDKIKIKQNNINYNKNININGLRRYNHSPDYFWWKLASYQHLRHIYRLNHYHNWHYHYNDDAWIYGLAIGIPIAVAIGYSSLHTSYTTPYIYTPSYYNSAAGVPYSPTYYSSNPTYNIYNAPSGNNSVTAKKDKSNGTGKTVTNSSNKHYYCSVNSSNKINCVPVNTNATLANNSTDQQNTNQASNDTVSVNQNAANDNATKSNNECIIHADNTITCPNGQTYQAKYAQSN